MPPASFLLVLVLFVPLAMFVLGIAGELLWWFFRVLGRIGTFMEREW